jgi:hypothetical protein
VFSPRGEPLDGPVQVLVALAVRGETGAPRLSVAHAIDFYGREHASVDYVFYCYGSSLLVARRLNQADTSLNLGALMPRIGGTGDGGHAGAAVCRPEARIGFPELLLGNVGARNFGAFARYLAVCMHEAGYPVRRVENRSQALHDPARAGGRRLAYITLLALVAGLLLVVGLRRFQRDEIAQSNVDFLPQLSQMPDRSGADEAREADAP